MFQVINIYHSELKSQERMYIKNIEELYNTHIYSITHELRTPLAVIENSCHIIIEMLKDCFRDLSNNGFSKEKILDYIKLNKRMVCNIDQHKDIISEFITKISRHGFYTESSTKNNKLINLRDFLTTISMNASSFNSKMKVFENNIEFMDCCHDKDVFVNIKSNDLTRILMNIIKNAGEACHRSYSSKLHNFPGYKAKLNIVMICDDVVIKRIMKSPTLHTYDFGKQNDVLILIEDNGPGIPPSLINKIFEQGTTTKTSGFETKTYNSGGMGMFLAYNLAKNNKINIYIDTTPNGTKFIIGIPALAN